jgi:hypothetical protein
MYKQIYTSCYMPLLGNVSDGPSRTPPLGEGIDAPSCQMSKK